MCFGILLSDMKEDKPGAEQELSILVVEDEKETNRAITRLIDKLDHNPVVAFSIEEALSLLDNQCFDIVIADYVLPGKLNGVDLLRKIHSQWPQIKRILISGRLVEETEIEKISESHVFDHFMKKPVTVPDLKNILNSMFQ